MILKPISKTVLSKKEFNKKYKRFMLKICNEILRNYFILNSNSYMITRFKNQIKNHDSRKKKKRTS